MEEGRAFMGWDCEGHYQCISLRHPAICLRAGDSGILMTGSHMTSPHLLPPRCHGVIVPALHSICVEWRCKQDDGLRVPGKCYIATW